MAAFLYRISITENRNKCHLAPKRPSSFCHTASTAQMLRAGIEKYRVFKVQILPSGKIYDALYVAAGICHIEKQISYKGKNKGEKFSVLHNHSVNFLGIHIFDLRIQGI